MPRISQRDQSVDGVQAVVLTVQLLEMIAFGGDAARVTDLASALGTSKTRIFRHLQTLVALGYVMQDPNTDRYRAGIRLAQLGLASANQFDLLSVSRPVMRKLRDALGHTVVLSKVESGRVYAMEQVDGSSLLRIGIVIGSPLGLHSSAQGKLVLAFGAADLLEATIKGGLVASASRTITSPDRLRREIASVRAQGWAVAPSETLTGLNAFAVPIFEAGDRLVGTMAILGSVDEIPRRPTPRYLTAMRTAAREISSSLSSARPRTILSSIATG
jgi:IclR family transcriptional regulator, KDG regulon repressor